MASRPEKITLVSFDNSCIFKIYEHEEFDVDSRDGTKYHRVIMIKSCGCETPFHLKMDDYEVCVEKQLANGYFRVLK